MPPRSEPPSGSRGCRRSRGAEQSPAPCVRVGGGASMRSALLVISSALLAATCTAQARPFSTDFPSGSKLRIRARSGEVRVVGTDENKISVDVSGKKAGQASDLRVWMTEKSGASELRI